ncbi:hypothetical protein [Asticcacaulis benevestitus]|uniref:hypothetical protein n=1 Tax=Asticcacaulis benevestitus TaxID=347481 RepID=UPI0003A0D239|nr:hypothetical protein [Asticcacaulis benevestitus]
MYNLVVMGGGWQPHRSSFTRSRIFEYTEDHIAADHTAAHGPNFNKLMQYPALFMSEEGSGDNLARVGQITRVSASSGGDIILEYSFDTNIPPVPVPWIGTIAGELQMADFEFNRTHWALKDVDIYRVFLRALTPLRNRPTVFTVSEATAIDASQMSAMMPFDAGFTPVYEAIQRAGASVGMTVNRADDIWIHHQIMQDIVSLIDRSRIIVADCTGKNPNVFYEVGIAHALGREVILITQHIDYVPFDLRHLRVITYYPNAEGLQALEMAIRDRSRTLLSI